MERLTIPDKPIEGGMRRAIIDTRAVREEAMKIYWALKKYEDTGLTPKEIMDGKVFSGWIPAAERLPGLHTDVLVAVTDVDQDDPSTFIDCLMESDSGKLMWSTFNGALEKVLAWMPLPEPYRPEN